MAKPPILTGADIGLENENWMRYMWAAPKYRSRAFFKYLKERRLTLERFKRTTMYEGAVKDGLIKGDKWVGPWPPYED